MAINFDQNLAEQSEKESSPGMQQEAMTEGDLARGSVKLSHQITRAAARLLLDEKRLVSAAITRLNFNFARQSVPEEVQHYLDQQETQFEQMYGSRVRITAREFSELYGIQLKYAYDQLRTAFNSLMNKQISFKAGQYTRKTQWVWDGGYHDGQGYVDILLSNTVIQHCRDIEKHFTLYPLSQAGQLRLDNSWKLYALLARFAQTGLIRCSLEELCDELNAPASYRAKVSHLKRYALDPAIAEIKERLGLKVTYSLQKVGRRYEKVEIRFDPANWQHQQQELKLQSRLKHPHGDTRENRKRVTASIMDIEDTDW